MNLYLIQRLKLQPLKELCASIDVPVELASVWANGAEGGVALAETLVKTIAETQLTTLVFMTTTFLSKKKIEKIVTEIYRGSKSKLRKKAQTQIAQIVQMAGINYQSVWLRLSIVLRQSQCTWST